MFKLIKRLFYFIVIASIVFFAVALWSGGEKFRWFGEKTGGAIKESSEKLAKKADEIKNEKDKALRVIKKLTGGDEVAEDSAQDKQHVKKLDGASQETSKENIKGLETGSDKEDGNKASGNSHPKLWERILEKVRALTKG